MSEMSGRRRLPGVRRYTLTMRPSTILGEARHAMGGVIHEISRRARSFAMPRRDVAWKALERFDTFARVAVSHL